MSVVFLLSVLLKGAGAVLEVVTQVLITQSAGVDGYGTYAAWINAADLVYWVMFSGLVRCNTYYLSDLSANITSFKKNFYLRYAIPSVLVASAVAVLSKHGYVCLILSIVLMELAVQDRSSTLMARKRAVPALFGEYVLGRLLLFIGILSVMRAASHPKIVLFVWLYLIQFVLVLIYLWIHGKSREETREVKVSMEKLLRYQRADIVQSLITQAPVIVQYAFVGSFEAGVVGIVLIIKKLVNFISGPAAKVFLPEFSRCYQSGDRKGIRSSYASIMRIQMLFITPMAVMMIGFAPVILRIFAEDLLPFRILFMGCSSVFLIAATLGPSAGLMQMTEHEKTDNLIRECALFIMILVFILFRKDPYAILYSLCLQTVIESVTKFLFVSRWMREAPVGLKRYMGWWIIPVLLIMLALLIHLENSLVAMIAFSVMAGVAALFPALRDEELLQHIRRKM